MRSAIAASVVPVYQEIARRIGPERMQKYVDLFEYGNRDIGGGIDQFWLTGNLRIDPIEQVDFIDRLRRGALPVSRRSQELVRTSSPSARQASPSSGPRAAFWAPNSASHRSAGWSAGPRRAARIPCLHSTWMGASPATSRLA
jgi:beta-lactamase class D